MIHIVYGELVKTITQDGIELQGFWIDKKSDIAVFHSHGTAGDFYTHKFIEVEGEKLALEHMSFLTANNRGHDVYADVRKHQNGNVEWKQIGGAFERFEECIFDITAWLDFLSKRGVRKIILQGHSLSQKLIYYQNQKRDPRIIGQIHLSPCNDAGFMYFLLGERKYLETNKMIQKMIDSGKERELLPKELAVVCPMSALAYSGYLTEESLGNIFPYHNSNSPKWELVSKIREPILAIFGGADTFIKPSSEDAARLLKQKAKAATVKIIQNAPHSYVGFEDELVGEIIRWIKNVK